MDRNIEFPENATPIDDFSGLKPKWVHTLQDLNRAEGENILRAYRTYFEGSVFKRKTLMSISTLKNIHIAMFGGVWEWAGAFRKTSKSIGIPAYKVSMELHKLKEDVNWWLESKAKLSPLLQAAIIHHRLVFIHPFENGNGRFARFVSDIHLFTLVKKHFIWPKDLGFNSTNRKCYIEALKAADKGSYTELVEFLNKKCLR